MHSRGAAPDRVASVSRLRRSSVGAYADAVVEAGWLAALVVVPLFFSPFSDRAFEPAKVAILRSLAGVMCAAWLAGWLAARGSGRSQSNPLAIPVLLLLAANVLATAASISPATSLVGAYERSQGLYTTASYIAIFFLVATRMRSLRQVERAITAALVTSFAVALYGVLQRHGLDPLLPDPSFSGASGSTLGNPAFLGGYLAMTAPLTLMRLVAAAGDAAARAGVLLAAATACVATLVLAFALDAAVGAGVALLVLAGWLWPVARAWPVALYSIVLAVQVSALLASETLGPALGLVGAMCVFVALHALLRGRGRLLAGVAVAGALGLAVVAALDPPGSSSSSANVTADVRKHVWEAALELGLPHEPLWSAQAGSDHLNSVRPLLGHGPDSFYAASGHVLPPELGVLQGRTARPDHAHNQTLDALVEAGVIGLVAYLMVLGTVLYLALHSLGFVTSGERRAFAVACAGGATLAALLVAVAFGRAFVGLAMPAGMAAAAAIWLVRGAARRAPPRATHTEALLVAIVAGLTAHVIDAQVSIATTTALTYFWILAAAAVVLARVRHGDTSSPADETAPLAAVPLLSGLVLATLVFGFVNATTASAFPSESTVAVVLLAGASVAVAAGMQLPLVRRGPAIVSAATLALLFAFSGPFLLTVERSDEGDLSALLAGAWVLLGFVLLSVLLLGAALVGEHRRTGGPAPGARVASALAAAALLAGLSLWVNGRIAEADIVHAQAPPVSRSDQLVQRFEAAADKQPLHDRARVLLADAHVRRAWLAATRELTDQELGRGEQALLRARRLNPYEGDHTLELAILNERAARFGGLRAEARDRFARGARHYAAAVRMSPDSAYVRDARAHALLEYASFLERAGDVRGAARLRGEARRQLRRAHALDPEYCLTLALRALAGTSWRAQVIDALASLDRSRGPCGDDGLERKLPAIAARALARAAARARVADETAEFVMRLKQQARPGRSRPRAEVAARALRRVRLDGGHVRQRDD